MRFHYNLSEYIEFEVTDNLLYIYDYHKVKSVNEIGYIIETLRTKYPTCEVLKRSNNSLIHEWRAKNFLYMFGFGKKTGIFRVNKGHNEVIHYILSHLYYHH